MNDAMTNARLTELENLDAHSWGSPEKREILTEIYRLRATVIRCHDLLELAYGLIDPEQEEKLASRIAEELEGPCPCPSPTQWEELEAELFRLRNLREYLEKISGNKVIWPEEMQEAMRSILAVRESTATTRDSTNEEWIPPIEGEGDNNG